MQAEWGREIFQFQSESALQNPDIFKLIFLYHELRILI